MFEAYLFVHFLDEHTEDSEQIYFSVSEDGMRWRTLNNARPVLKSRLGERGVRDPHILRTPDGEKFYMVATDLSIYYNGDWKRAVQRGSQSIMIWESTDLVNWSEQRMVKVAPDDAGCTWAPESIYDKDAGDYMVFWASTVKSDHYSKQRIYCAKTTDFKQFSSPQLYIEKENHIIDTTFIEHDGKYYRFSKDETHKSIIMEVGETLMGAFAPVDGFSMLNVVGYEGPTCYKINGQDKWCLLLDAYAARQGYKAFVTDDLATGHFEAAMSEFITPFKFRHGTVMPITRKEYNRLIEAYGVK